MVIKIITYKKRYVIGDAGIFDASMPLGAFLRECFRVMRRTISVDSSSGRKNGGKDIGMKAIDVGKTVAIDAGKKLVEKAAKKISTHKSQVANAMIPPEEITKK